MSRPKYTLTQDDLVDCCAWLSHQLSKGQWIEHENHPVHTLGIEALQTLMITWQSQTQADLPQIQRQLMDVLTDHDWNKLRKALFARKKRRQALSLKQKRVNITLTPQAHKVLCHYKQMHQLDTLSDAVEHAANIDANTRIEEPPKPLNETTLAHYLNSLSKEAALQHIEHYINKTHEQPNWAHSVQVAYQYYKKQPCPQRFQQVLTRFKNDLCWNYQFLGMPIHTFITF